MYKLYQFKILHVVDIWWWRHQMETFSALLAICAGNSPVPGEFPAQRPVTRSFDVFFDLRLNNDWVNNREAGDLRRYRAHYDVIVMIIRPQCVVPREYINSGVEFESYFTRPSPPVSRWYWLRPYGNCVIDGTTEVKTLFCLLIQGHCPFMEYDLSREFELDCLRCIVQPRYNRVNILQNILTINMQWLAAQVMGSYFTVSMIPWFSIKWCNVGMPSEGRD